MEKDLEYLAARRFMTTAVYDLPGIERPGFLHGYDNGDGAWEGMEDGGKDPLLEPALHQELSGSVLRNIVGAREMIRLRHKIANELNGMRVDQQR